MASASLSRDDEKLFIPIIDRMLRESDLATVSVKKLRNGLSQETGRDFTVIKKEISKLCTERFDKILAEQENGVNAQADGSVDADGEVDPDVEAEPETSATVSSGASASPAPTAGKKRKSASVDEDAKYAAELHAQLNGGGRPQRAGARRAVKPVKKGKSRKKKSDGVIEDSDAEANGDTPKKKRKVNPNNPFNKPMILSEALQALVGEQQLSRPATVKKIWAHIKAHDLQDPRDRRNILCDDQMKAVFGNAKISMFTMNKFLSQHMYKPDE